MSDGQIHAPSYLRQQSDKQLHLIANMIERQCEQLKFFTDQQSELTRLRRALETAVKQRDGFMRNYHTFTQLRPEVCEQILDDCNSEIKQALTSDDKQSSLEKKEEEK